MITAHADRIVEAAVRAAEHTYGGERHIYLSARRAAIVAWRRASGLARLPELAVRHCEWVAEVAVLLPSAWGRPCWPDDPSGPPRYWPR